MIQRCESENEAEAQVIMTKAQARVKESLDILTCRNNIYWAVAQAARKGVITQIQNEEINEEAEGVEDCVLVRAGRKSRRRTVGMLRYGDRTR